MVTRHHSGLDEAIPTASDAASGEASIRLEQGLAADQAERARRIAGWERRRQRLVASIENARRGVSYLLIGGSAVALLIVGGLSLAFNSDFSYSHPSNFLSFLGFSMLMAWGACLLAAFLLRVIVSACGEALGRNLLRAAAREGVELPEIRFD